MTAILLEPNTPEEAKLIRQLAKTLKIKATSVAETAKQRRKREILESIERGTQQVAAHLRGEIQLKSAREFLDEL
jgi:soluble P-type ATPase